MIALSYSAVHQIFQLALAAHEMGKLEALRCSMIALPGKWGKRFVGLARIPSATPLGYELLPGDKVIEDPWPVIAHRLTQRILRNRRTEHLHMNTWFDRRAARWLRHSKAQVFVGAETCALLSMQVAKKMGMSCVLDCAGIPNAFLDRVAQEAAVDFDMRIPSSSNSPEMELRKRKELELADLILCCSEFQAEKLVENGAVAGKVRVIPLWSDISNSEYDQPAKANKGPLQVIYAGAVSLKKGAPYLIEAMRQLGDRAQLTMVGNPSPEMTNMLGMLPPNCKQLSYVSKHELRRLYAEHDVLVMPTLGDSFGFVIMEAMAAGLAVIASNHSGAPLPSTDWRVPARSTAALVKRLLHYASQHEVLIEDQRKAKAFAAQWNSQRYRSAAGAVFSELLK